MTFSQALHEARRLPHSYQEAFRKKWLFLVEKANLAGWTDWLGLSNVPVPELEGLEFTFLPGKPLPVLGAECRRPSSFTLNWDKS